MGTHSCLTPSLRRAAAGLRDLLDPQVPQDPLVPLDLLAPQVPLEVLDAWDPQALLDPKGSQATQARRVRGDRVESLAPKALKGSGVTLAPRETLARKATGGRDCTSCAKL